MTDFNRFFKINKDNYFNKFGLVKALRQYWTISQFYWLCTRLEKKIDLKCLNIEKLKYISPFPLLILEI